MVAAAVIVTVDVLFVVVVAAILAFVLRLIVRFVGVIVGGHGGCDYFSKKMTNRPRMQSRPPNTPLS